MNGFRFAGEPGSIRCVIPPLLRDNRNFRNYFFGQAVSLLGDQITLIALPLTAVLALHATAGQMGALDDRRARPEPDLLAPRRQLGRPPRRPPAGDARRGRGPRHPDRDGSRRLRARPPDVGAALRGRVRLRCALGLLLRRVRRLLPDDRRARGRALETIPHGDCRHAIKRALDRDRPDAVVVAGYAHPESMVGGAVGSPEGPPINLDVRKPSRSTGRAVGGRR